MAVAREQAITWPLGVHEVQRLQDYGDDPRVVPRGYSVATITWHVTSCKCEDTQTQTACSAERTRLSLIVSPEQLQYLQKSVRQNSDRPGKPPERHAKRVRAQQLTPHAMAPELVSVQFQGNGEAIDALFSQPLHLLPRVCCLVEVLRQLLLKQCRMQQRAKEKPNTINGDKTITN